MPCLQSRVVFGVRTEITSLTEIPQVQGYRARLLYDNGMRSPELIAAADVSLLASILAKGADRPFHCYQPARLHVCTTMRAVHFA